MLKRTLGQKLVVSSIGLGCMGMSEFYGPSDNEESLKTLRAAVDMGITFFDTSDTYGLGENEKLIGRFLKERGRKEVTLATKFGIVRESRDYARGINNEPEYARVACEQSLKRLGTDYIDLYYIHRIDPQRPIEDVMMVLSDLVAEGKIGHIGLCEVREETLRRAHAVHPVSALQTEYSLWSREPEANILGVCRELGVGFVPYSPLGRGFLTTKLNPDELKEGDFRKSNPRFTGENYESNLEITKVIRDFSAEKGCTPAQLVLAWLLAQEDWIVPIPGTRRIEYLKENVGAIEVKLSAAEVDELSGLLPAGIAAGDRYVSEGMKGINA